MKENKTKNLYCIITSTKKYMVIADNQTEAIEILYNNVFLPEEDIAESNIEFKGKVFV